MHDNDYSDIIEQQWPRNSTRPKMQMKLRAKIFLPFAALNGHNEALQVVKETVEQNFSDSEKGKTFDESGDCAFWH